MKTPKVSFEVEEDSGITRTTYRLEGKISRLDGPAVVGFNGYKEYWVGGKRHCLEGPAILDSEGTSYYYINGVIFTEKEFIDDSRTMLCNSDT